MSEAQPATDAYTIKALGADTWDDFEALAGRHNGVWSGCWCMWFHPENAEKGSGAEGNRLLKKQLARTACSRTPDSGTPGPRASSTA
jgi:hypothetical protein